jgi:hypothetical protein
MGVSEMSENHDDSTRAPVNDNNAQDVDLRDLNAKHVVEDGKDVHLVNWYSPEDPEVWRPPSRIREKQFLSQRLGSPELV